MCQLEWKKVIFVFFYSYNMMGGECIDLHGAVNALKGRRQQALGLTYRRAFRNFVRAASANYRK